MNGILLVNKPKDYTSRDIVNIISKKLNTKKVGHTGTLDPIAEGVLVLCIGSSLKLVEILTNHDKEYIAELIVGYETDTLDITGSILKEKKINNLEKKQVKNVLKNFTGEIIQEVPKYSAVKVNGKKLYEYARNNIEVDLPKRKVNIYDIELFSDIKKDEDNNFIFKIKCRVSRGTYIRSLIRDIGLSLGSYATMKSLIRTSLGDFNIKDSYTLEQIDNNEYELLDPIDVLSFPKVIVDSNMENKIRNGMILDKFFNEDTAIILNKNNELLAIYKVKDNDKLLVKPWKMF